MINPDALALFGSSVATTITTAAAIAMMIKSPRSRIGRYSESLHLGVSPCLRNLHIVPRASPFLAIYEPLDISPANCENSPEAWNGRNVSPLVKKLVKQKLDDTSKHLGMFRVGEDHLISPLSSVVKFQAWEDEIAKLKLDLRELQKNQNRMISAEMDRILECLREIGKFVRVKRSPAVEATRVYRNLTAHQLTPKECLQAIKDLPHETDEDLSIINDHKIVFRVAFGVSDLVAKQFFALEEEYGRGYNVDGILHLRARLFQSLTGDRVYKEFSTWADKLTNLQKDPESVDKRKAATEAAETALTIAAQEKQTAEEGKKLRSIRERMKYWVDYNEMEKVFELAGVRKVFEDAGFEKQGR